MQDVFFTLTIKNNKAITSLSAHAIKMRNFSFSNFVYLKKLDLFIREQNFSLSLKTKVADGYPVTNVLFLRTVDRLGETV